MFGIQGCCDEAQKFAHSTSKCWGHHHAVRIACDKSEPQKNPNTGNSCLHPTDSEESEQNNNNNSNSNGRSNSTTSDDKSKSAGGRTNININ